MRMWALDRYYYLRVMSFLLAWMLMQMPMSESIANFRPQWVLMTLMWWLWNKPSRLTLPWVVTIALITDYLSGLPLGVHVLSFIVVAGCVQWLFPKLMHFNRWQQCLFSIALLALNLFVLRLGFFMTHVDWSWPAMIETHVATLLVWMAMAWAFNFHAYWFAHVD